MLGLAIVQCNSRYAIYSYYKKIIFKLIYQIINKNRASQLMAKCELQQMR